MISGFRREDGRQDADFYGWQIPTLLIVGDQDAIFPPAAISEVQKTIPRLPHGDREGYSPLRALRKGRRIQRPPVGVLRQHPSRATRTRPCRLAIAKFETEWLWVREG